VGRVDVSGCGLVRAPGGFEVGTGTPLPVERGDVRRAVRRGHLEMLKWAREHGCPWTAATRDEAASIGYSDNLPLSV